MKEKHYTIKEFLKAAEIGHASLSDTRYICSFLEMAKKIEKKGFDCKTCEKYSKNQFTTGICKQGYYLENGKDCGGTEYKKAK